VTKEPYYPYYTSRMARIFTAWKDKRIDNAKAIEKLKAWYNKGLRVLEHENEAEADREQLKKHFHTFSSLIRDNDDEFPGNYLNHTFMKILKDESPPTYDAMRKAIAIRLVVYENGIFNFKCAKGCVGLFFHTAGFTRHKMISNYIMICGEKPGKSTLKNGVKNAAPFEWENLEQQLFS